MSQRARISATVETDLLDAARAAVADGRAESVSAWLNEAMRRQRDHEQRLLALGAFIASYEEEHGPISDDEIRRAERQARARAVVVRGPAG
jgi:Arc/MetJ-type ribon-helix-helix transcriptional regulator